VKKIALVYGPEGLKHIGILLKKLEEATTEVAMLRSENEVLRGIISGLEHRIDTLEEELG
jgi:hypothetical protein